MNVKTNFKKHLSLCFIHNKKSSCFNHGVMEANGQKTAFDIIKYRKSEIAKPLTPRGCEQELKHKFSKSSEQKMHRRLFMKIDF